MSCTDWIYGSYLNGQSETRAHNTTEHGFMDMYLQWFVS